MAHSILKFRGFFLPLVPSRKIGRDFYFVNSFSVESCEKIAQLFEKHSKLSSAVKDKPAAAAGKRGRSSAPSSPTSSLMSMQGITNILRKILESVLF